MEYTIPGNNGKVYTISYDVGKEYYKCSCPDFIYRRSKTNEMCKHICRIKTMDDYNVNPEEYTKRGITVKILNPIALADQRNNSDIDIDADYDMLATHRANKKQKTKNKKQKTKI